MTRHPLAQSKFVNEVNDDPQCVIHKLIIYVPKLI